MFNMQVKDLRYLLFLLIFSVLLRDEQVAAQNLVANCSFESYIHCPDFWNDVDSCVSWKQYHDGTPDYFNKCDMSNWVGVPSNAIGNQAACDGDAYMGLIAYSTVEQPNYREYITAQLISPMKTGGTYEVSMLVSLADSSRWWVNGLGIHFYLNGPAVPVAGTKSVLDIEPKVMYQAIDNYKNWELLSKQFIADSPYSNIIIGNWIADSNQARGLSIGNYQYSYYYIDSVVVRMLTSIFIDFQDSILCAPGMFTVPYHVIAGVDSFGTNNEFTVQLSDAFGSFNNPVNIGSHQSSSSGFITCSLPNGINVGSAYRIRIISSNPIRYSLDNGTDITISLFPQNVKAKSNSPVCSGDILRIETITSTDGGKYIWKGPGSFFSDQPKITFPAALTHNGVYVVTVSAGSEYCSVKDSIAVIVNQAPEDLYATVQGTLCNGDSIRLTAGNNVAGVRFAWYGPGSFFTADSITYISAATATGQYIVKASIGDCTESVPVEVEDCTCKPIIPTAFTPNNDGLNDVIHPIVNCEMVSYEFSIMNRFGEIAFRSNVYGEVWDGTYKGVPCDLGTYFYYLTLRTHSGHNYVFKGDITLIH